MYCVIGANSWNWNCIDRKMSVLANPGQKRQRNYICNLEIENIVSTRIDLHGNKTEIKLIVTKKLKIVSSWIDLHEITQNYT